MATASQPALSSTIRELRLARGLSLGVAAQQAKVSKGSIVGWEAGQYLPKGPALARLLDVYQTEPRLRARLILAIDPVQAKIENARSFLGAPVIVGDVLRAMRGRRQATQADLARTLQISQSTVTRWESGESIPDSETIHRICFALGASVEEAVALSCTRPSAPIQMPEDRDEAEKFIVASLKRAEPGFYEIVSLGMEAELWRRSTADDQWDLLLCQILAYRANYFFIEGRLAEISDLARRAIQMAKTPEMKIAACPAIGALAAVARHRKENPQIVAEAIRPWMERLPTHGNKAWMLWIRALRLAAMGQREEAVDLTERSSEMIATVATPFPGWEAAVANARLEALCEVYLLAGAPEKAAAICGNLRHADANLQLYVRVQHALGLAAADGDMFRLRRFATDPQSRNWRILSRLQKIESEQDRLLCQPA